MAAEVLYQIIDSKDPTNLLNLTPVLDAPNVQAAMVFGQARKPVTLVLPFSDGEYDPFGDKPWPLAGRDVTFTFARVYGVGESFTSVLDSFQKLILGPNPLSLVWKTTLTPYTLRYGTGKGVSVPRGAAADFVSYCTLQATIHMTQPLTADATPNGWSTWDQVSPGLIWDQVGLAWDTNPDDFSITSQVNTHSVTNLGTAGDKAPILQVYDATGVGYFQGPIYFYNLSITYPDGLPMYLVYNDDLHAGEHLYIDTSIPSARIVKGAGVTMSVWNKLQFHAGQDEWFRIKTGTNNLRIQCQSANPVGPFNARAQIVWTQRYF